MSQIHEMTTSPWGHSVITVWCHRYLRWPHHHEVTVLSQDDVHHVISSWYQNYYITSVMFLWGHSDTSWAHHLEVTVLSQYDVTGTQGDHITMRSQCCHMTMLTWWGHYDVLMIAKLWHHMCEMFVRSQWQFFITSPWGHSVVIVWCHRYTRWPHHYDVTMLSHCDVTDTKIWPHHHEVTVLSQNDAHHMMSLWCLYDIEIMTSHVWVVCEITVTRIDHITMRS